MFARYLCAALLGALAFHGSAASGAGSAPTLLLRSARALDTTKNTVVLPLHRGSANGKSVWYILTDVSDPNEAKARGLVFAAQLSGVGATQHVTSEGGMWHFAAAPDFSAERVFQAGPTGFPPAKAAPGSVADAAYSPFVTVGSSATVYNAPIVATGDGPFDVTKHSNTLDRVLAIDPTAGTVTLLLANGFAAGKEVFYISTEASDPGAATIERATYAPAIGKAPAGARLRILVIVNGQEQGLAFAALHGNLNDDATTANSSDLKTSRNVLGGLPAAGPDGGVYDPLWDVSVGVWTPAAVAAGRNVTLRSAADVQRAVDAKDLTGPDGKAFGPVGFDVNCAVIAVAP
ncbi:MAG TPA: hypothetical protein VKG44_01205 [Candidatus Baltobacteraceae bacterium]|nr:hypothetical protein [Candidatus Baltobacteraceae bacterium]